MFTKNIETLARMHTFRRPAGSKTEKQFIRWFLEPLGVTFDTAGNVHKRIGDAPILWSCHTDTVHYRAGYQHVHLSAKGQLTVNDKQSNCLGADDTAGVWLMIEMIKANVPGLYIFHRGEERGGIGSSYISEHEPELVANIEYAIAFDRSGQDEIITHQLHRCCSDEFAKSLGSAIGLGHKPSAHGIFTDTANYTDIIPECTNLSVGYEHMHSFAECLDTDYLRLLRDYLCKADFSGLISKRKPGDGTDDYGDNYSWTRHYYSGTDLNCSYTPMEQLVHDFPITTAKFLERNFTTDVSEMRKLLGIYPTTK